MSNQAERDKNLKHNNFTVNQLTEDDIYTSEREIRQMLLMKTPLNLNLVLSDSDDSSDYNEHIPKKLKRVCIDKLMIPFKGR